MEIAVTIILKSKFGFCHNIIFSLGIFNNIIVCLVRVDMVLTCLSYLPGAFTCVYHILYDVTTLLLSGSYLPHLLPICHICCPAANPFSPIYLVITSVLPSSPIYLVIAPIQVF